MNVTKKHNDMFDFTKKLKAVHKQIIEQKKRSLNRARMEFLQNEVEILCAEYKDDLRDEGKSEHEVQSQCNHYRKILIDSCKEYSGDSLYTVIPDCEDFDLVQKQELAAFSTHQTNKLKRIRTFIKENKILCAQHEDQAQDGRNLESEKESGTSTQQNAHAENSTPAIALSTHHQIFNSIIEKYFDDLERRISIDDFEPKIVPEFIFREFEVANYLEIVHNRIQTIIQKSSSLSPKRKQKADLIYANATRLGIVGLEEFCSTIDKCNSLSSMQYALEGSLIKADTPWIEASHLDFASTAIPEFNAPEKKPRRTLLTALQLKINTLHSTVTRFVKSLVRATSWTQSSLNRSSANTEQGISLTTRSDKK